MRRVILLCNAILALAAIETRPAHAQASATCATVSSDPDSNWVIWITGASEPDNPAWVAFDILRRALPGCDRPVRVNDESIPRVIGVTHWYYFGTVAPAGVMYEYTVQPVDANHQPVSVPSGFCSNLACVAHANCPPFSAVATMGSLQDYGFLFVMPCPGTCYPSAYLQGSVADQLRPYAGTNAVFRFWADNIVCGGVEGCSMNVDHWELVGDCGVTPTTSASWGKLKTIYR